MTEKKTVSCSNVFEDTGFPSDETTEFMASLERSLQQALAGEYAAVHTPEMIAARRASGRPKLSEHKEPVTLRMSPEALARWRASGKGWQTRAAAVLAEHAPR